MKIDKTAILAALDELGNTPGAVAISLRKMGIKGHRRYDASCPLAVYLNRKFKLPDGTFSVWVHSVSTTDPEQEPVEFSDLFSRFVKKFDNGEYPELID